MKRQFSNRQVVVIVAAVCLAVVAAPVGALAATGTFTISDPTHPARKAHVDAGGHLSVGDGGGSLTVDGATRPLAPAHAWSASVRGFGQESKLLVGPSASAIEVTSVLFSVDGIGSADRQFMNLFVTHVPATASTCSPGAQDQWPTSWVWGVSMADYPPVEVPFPTPLRIAPPSGQKLCLYGWSDDNWLISASGYRD